MRIETLTFSEGYSDKKIREYVEIALKHVQEHRELKLTIEWTNKKTVIRYEGEQV